MLVKSEISVYFGEAFGRHSQVLGSIEPSEIILITDDEKEVAMFEENKLQSGYNPFNEQTISVCEKYIDEYEDLSIRQIVDMLIEKEIKQV